MTRIILIGVILVCSPKYAFADPDRPPGRIVFIGTTSNGQRTVWLSVTTAGNFEVQARNQTVDTWGQAQPGLHATLSPIVSNGSGDPHSLFQIINGELVFIDKDNQQGGIIFPPFPGGLPPGEVTPPIALPPVFPSHPIEIPPVGSDSSSNRSSGSSRNDGLTRRAPLTPGREFAKEPVFNIWMDGRYFNIKDYRFGLDRIGYATNLTMGADRRINKDLVVGAMLARNTGKSSSFNDTWQTSARGFTCGPYFGYRFSPSWAIDGTLGFGQIENYNDIAILKGQYTIDVYSTSIIATGVYNADKIQLRLKPAIYYNYFYSAGYTLNTNFDGFLFSVPIDSNKFSFGFSQVALELSRPILLAKDSITIIPYVELGVNYAFVRPNGGQILTGNLTLQQTSPWSGLARLGVRTLITRSLFIEATASYLSIGQSHLNVWQGRIFMSWAFY